MDDRPDKAYPKMHLSQLTMKYLKLILALTLVMLLLSCRQQKIVLQGDLFAFSSADLASLNETLNTSNSLFALDTYTGIFYYRKNNRWYPSNPEIDNISLFSSVLAQEGQVIQVRGFYNAGDGGHASFKVVTTVPLGIEYPNTIFKLSNGNYAVRLLENHVNVFSFGAKGDTDISGTGTDDTKAFQDAINYLCANGGGQLFIPSIKDKFFKISNVYLKSGIRLTGEITASSQETKSLLGSKILVSNGGQGLIIGDKDFRANKRVSGVVVEHLVIKGIENSFSGIRLGSDRSFITPVNITIDNCLIEGFVNPNLSQIVYDKSTAALGKDDDNYIGTHPVNGACGIFIAGAISASFNNVRSQKNYNGLYESSGGFCTALNFSGGAYRHNIKSGMVFTTVKSAALNNLLVIETNGEEGLKIIAPKTAVEKLQWGPGHFFIENIHLENNNFKRKAGYSILIKNENEKYFINNISISNSRLDFNRYDGIYIDGGKGVKIHDNGILILPNRTQVYTNRCENVEYDGQVVGKMDLDNQTRLLRKGQNELKRSSGNILADYRSKKNTSDQKSSLIIQGDIAILPDYVVSGKDAFKLTVWGRFMSDIEKNSLTFRFNDHLILENTTIIKTSGNTWFAEIVISAGQSAFPNQAKTFGRLQMGNEFEPLQIYTLKENNLWKKTNRIYVACQSGEVFLEGYQLSYQSY